MPNVKEATKVVKSLDSDTPSKAVKVAEKVIKAVGPKPRRMTVFVDMTPVTPEVSFTGGLWTAMDVKLANRAIRLAFRKMLRDLYRKEYKK